MENLSQQGQQRWSKVRSNAPSTLGRSFNLQPEELKYSKFNTPEDLAAFSQKSDEGVKKVFSTSNSRVNQHVKFGSLRDNDPDYGIKAGKLTLTG